MSSLMIAFILIPVISVLIYFYKKYWDDLYKYWEKKGVPHIPGKYPQGSSEEYTKGASFLGEIMYKFYRQFAGEPYFGIYKGTERHLVLRDPEVIKLILAKDFSHFRSRMGFKFKKDDILSHHLFLLDGDKWRSLRVKVSPVFSSGKLKGMFHLFQKCSNELDKLLASLLDSEIDVKDITRRYSTDVICTCAFGLEMDCINNENNPFRIIASDSGPPKRNVFLSLLAVIQKYLPFIRIMPASRITAQHVEDFMMATVKETVEHREKTGQKRNDFIDLLIQLKEKGRLNDDLTEEEMKEKNIEPLVMTLEVMAAQCYVFYAAGHETSSSVVSFCLYELALNLDIQERLCNEIDNTVSKHGGITYQALNEMEYLDMVVSETMRKYPTLFYLSRVCTSDFTLPSGLKIKKDEKIIIPVWSLHHDPEYYTNPEIFLPERFMPEEKNSRNPFAYLPFGEGPRICIGMRFGLLQSKMGIITYLKKYKILPSEKTVVPLTMKGEDFNPVTRPASPIILTLTKRS